MLVQEGLRQLKEGQVSPQGPAGPTLAAQMAQAAAPEVAQNDPSMAPPPLGQEPEGEVANVAQNAGLGAAIQGQQQQQAQQAMMQMAQQQQQAQQQPAMMAGGGIAGLAADNMRGFKEGGVLGFNAGESVPKAFGSEEDYNKSNEGQGVATARQEIAKAEAKATASAERAAQEKAYAFDKTPEGQAILARKMATARGDRLPEGLNRVSAASIPPQTDTVPEGIVQLPAKRPVESVQMPGSNVIAEAAKQLRESMAAKNDQTAAYTDPNRARLDVPVSGGKPSVAGPSVARPTGAANVPSPPAAPALDLPGLLAQARKATPEQSNVFLDKQAAAQEELNKLRAAQPAPNQVALQALLDAQQKRARLSEQDEAGAGGRGLAALFQGMMGRNEGSSVAAHNEREKQRRRLDIAETLADKEKESAIRDIQAAKAAGDKEKEAAGYKDLGLSKQKSQEIQALREGQSIQAAYQLKSREMENASAEKLQLMRQRHDNATKMMPNWEQTQIKAQVDKLAGPGADMKKILAATEAVLIAHGKMPGEAGAAAKDAATRVRASESWAKEPANSTRLMMAANNPEKLKALYKERDESINALMGTPNENAPTTKLKYNAATNKVE
jgi:hypothetical protein